MKFFDDSGFRTEEIKRRRKEAEMGYEEVLKRDKEIQRTERGEKENQGTTSGMEG